MRVSNAESISPQRRGERNGCVKYFSTHEVRLCSLLTKHGFSVLSVFLWLMHFHRQPTFGRQVHQGRQGCAKYFSKHEVRLCFLAK